MFKGRILVNSSLVDSLAEAIKANTPLPEFNEDLSLEEAYEIQRAVTAAVSPAGAGGIKAGVTSKIAQTLFKLDHALIGALYADAQHKSGCSIPFLERRSIECEVAVLADDDGNPSHVAPAIEMVYVRYSRQSDMSAASLITCNLGADLYIVGDFQPWNERFSDTQITLHRDGSVLNEATIDEPLGGPIKSTNWIWDEANRRGFAPSAGVMFLTGACGNVIPAEIGEYTAEFGDLGAVTWRIE